MLYCRESNIYAASTDILPLNQQKKKKKKKFFFLLRLSSSNRLSSLSFSNPFDGLYRSTEKLSVRSVKPEGRNQRWHFEKFCRPIRQRMIEIGVLINSFTEFPAGRRPSSPYYHMGRQLRPVRTNS